MLYVMLCYVYIYIYIMLYVMLCIFPSIIKFTTSFSIEDGKISNVFSVHQEINFHQGIVGGKTSPSSMVLKVFIKACNFPVPKSSILF